MIEIGIDPVIANIGSLEIRWYGIFVVLAVAVGIIVPILLAKRWNIGVIDDRMLSLATVAVPGGIIGARLVHVVEQWNYYAAHPGEILGFEGTAVYGAILGGTLAGALYARFTHMPVGKIADVVAFGLILGQVVGRIGCTINGCCYGISTSLPWAFVYTHPSTHAPLNAAVHPTQVYELLWDLVVFSTIWIVRPRLKQPGALFFVYLSTYSLGRFLISFLRANDTIAFGLQQAQLIAMLVFVLSGYLLLSLVRKKAPATSPVE